MDKPQSGWPKTASSSHFFLLQYSFNFDFFETNLLLKIDWFA